ncbi:hypothetical protein U1769_11350 [Sphingomonas sp. ZT3P38]|uniref:hypothetical protein n=1 Tax=Parasphingomonas zepuensis TaxID=3096161 RepID=UPI002FCAAA4C
MNKENMLGQIQANSRDTRQIDRYLTHGRCSLLDRFDNDLSLAPGLPESTANQSAVHTITVIPAP